MMTQKSLLVVSRVYAISVSSVYHPFYYFTTALLSSRHSNTEMKADGLKYFVIPH